MPLFRTAKDDRSAARPPLERSEIEELDRWWRAANYLSVGQIYLLDNPLLERTLEAEDIKPRLLGHWGTTPGLNLRLDPPEPADPRSGT